MTSSPESLRLHEELMLLALKDEEGTIESGTMYQYAIGGAVLAELLLAGRIRLEARRKKQFAEVVDRSSTSEPLLDECLERIAGAKRSGSLQTWVGRLAGLKGLKHRVAQGLCRKGILRADEDKVLLIFTRKIYPELDPEPEQALIARLREAIFTETGNVDARTVVLVSLANAAGLLKPIFGRKNLKARKARIESVVNGDVLGSATKEAIQAMQAAVMVACVMPAIMAATVSH